MLKKIQQVLRSVMLLGNQCQRRTFKNAGGLFVLFWTQKGTAQSLICTVAAAGPWCMGIKLEALQSVLTDLKESSSPYVWSCLQPDPEELCAFAELYGSLRLLLSFQMKDAVFLSPDWCNRVEVFFHTFSLVNAGINIHLKFNFNQNITQQVYRVDIRSKVALQNQRSVILDVTSRTQPPECVKKGQWCQGGHPILGDRLPLCIPSEALDQGLFGELSMQPVSFLSPCVLQHPNLPTRITHIQVTICCPSNIEVSGPSTFFQNLPTHLDCQELGLCAIHCSTSKELVHSGGIIYTVEEEHCEDQEQKLHLPLVQQRLLLFLFLQYSDPFTSQLSDIMATEMLIERHLEDVLNNNKQAVITSLQAELKNTLEAQNRRQKVHQKLRSAAEVILRSSIRIVSRSSNVDFRSACLNSMRVRDTHELSESIYESLGKVISSKFISRSKCYATQMEVHHESGEATRVEI